MSAQLHTKTNPRNPRVFPQVRLFAVLGTWMEEDVVAASVHNAFVQGCERVYVVDNGSTDGTVNEACRAGAIHARSFHTDRYDESARLQHMNAVVAETSADEPDEHLWWLFLDADEFIHGPHDLSIVAYLRQLDAQFRVVGARFFNHYPDRQPHYIPGFHPLDFQPLCEELVYPMCPQGHRKHPLQRYDRHAAPIECGRGFHLVTCRDELFEPEQPVFLHHFPFRDETVTRRRLDALWTEDPPGTARASASDDATGHMIARHRSLDAVYAQDWASVENFITQSQGVVPKPWRQAVDPEHRVSSRWTSVVGAWRYDGQPFRYGDDTTYEKGIRFLDSGGVIEDWGCGFAHARHFVKSSHYIGIDGSSPHADRRVDLREYRSTADCIFMRHVLEHNVEWRRILAGAVASFTKRMALVLFTPLVDETRIIAAATHVTAVKIPDLAFRKDDLTECFDTVRWREEALETDTQYGVERVFYLER